MRVAGLLGPCMTLFLIGLCWTVFYISLGYALLIVLEKLVGG